MENRLAYARVANYEEIIQSAEMAFGAAYNLSRGDVDLHLHRDYLKEYADIAATQTYHLGSYKYPECDSLNKKRKILEKTVFTKDTSHVYIHATEQERKAVIRAALSARKWAMNRHQYLTQEKETKLEALAKIQKQIEHLEDLLTKTRERKKFVEAKIKQEPEI